MSIVLHGFFQLLAEQPFMTIFFVLGARNSTTAMCAISDKSKSTMPSFGYSVP